MNKKLKALRENYQKLNENIIYRERRTYIILNNNKRFDTPVDNGEEPVTYFRYISMIIIRFHYRKMLAFYSKVRGCHNGEYINDSI